MDTEATTAIMNPIIQYGFAGLCVVLLAILVWLVRELLSVMRENNAVISANNQAIVAVQATAKATFDVSIECKDKLVERPCIARFNVNKG